MAKSCLLLRKKAALDELLAAGNQSYAARGTKQMTKGLRFSEPIDGRVVIRGLTWGEAPNDNGAVFVPNSCSNLDEFVRKGTINVMHNRRQQIGAPVWAEQTSDGLYIGCEFLKNRRGRDAATVMFERILWGKDNAASVTVSVPPNRVSWEFIGSEPYRVISGFELDECSFVDLGAHPGAMFVEATTGDTMSNEGDDFHNAVGKEVLSEMVDKIKAWKASPCKHEWVIVGRKATRCAMPDCEEIHISLIVGCHICEIFGGVPVEPHEVPRELQSSIDIPYEWVEWPIPWPDDSRVLPALLSEE
jgi:hypothetical protein